MTIFESIQQSVKDKLPFVAYKKPNKSIIKGLFQENDTLHIVKNYAESGFVFAPFDIEKQVILIPNKDAVLLEEEVVVEEFGELNSSQGISELYVVSASAKKKHIKLVENGVRAIKDGLFKKVVLSRKKTIALSGFDIVTSFQKLTYNYPNAFVYVWFHPAIGLWLGASPETLLKVTENHFSTMALAGTQIDKELKEVVWLQKEKEEQQFVTDYIVDAVSKVCVDVQKSATETVKAGSLLHLKTAISGNLNTQKFTLKTLINALHPTPAVCGLPKEAAKWFIAENESYDRSFYTGFLGELNMDDSELYVNLRCMCVENKLAHLYVGGGITKDSDPELEWQETVSKSRTIKKVLS
ncbi:MAG: chorismate-binding protein [Polaribacter sp.]|nr:chorismate-binding protein [Polaribacter sp.]